MNVPKLKILPCFFIINIIDLVNILYLFFMVLKFAQNFELLASTILFIIVPDYPDNHDPDIMIQINDIALGP